MLLFHVDIIKFEDCVTKNSYDANLDNTKKIYTNQRKFITFGTMQTRINIRVNLLRILGPSSARNVSQSSARFTTPELVIESHLF